MTKKETSAKKDKEKSKKNKEKKEKDLKVLIEEQSEEVTSPKTKGKKKVIFPMYDGARVIEILQENVHGRWHHCKMDDGTTKHVPIELFA